MIRMGGPIVHIDVTTKVDGLRDFARLWRRRVHGEILGEPSQYISLADLLRTKRAADRAKDRADIEALERVPRAMQRRARTRRPTDEPLDAVGQPERMPTHGKRRRKGTSVRG